MNFDIIDIIIDGKFTLTTMSSPEVMYLIFVNVYSYFECQLSTKF